MNKMKTYNRKEALKMMIDGYKMNPVDVPEVRYCFYHEDYWQVFEVIYRSGFPPVSYIDLVNCKWIIYKEEKKALSEGVNDCNIL